MDWNVDRIIQEPVIRLRADLRRVLNVFNNKSFLQDNGRDKMYNLVRKIDQTGSTEPVIQVLRDCWRMIREDVVDNLTLP